MVPLRCNCLVLPLALLCLPILPALCNNHQQRRESCDGKTVDYSEWFDERGQCVKPAPVELSSKADLVKMTQGRERTAWRFKYVGEYRARRAKVLVQEKSIDERLANLVYTSGTTKIKFHTQRFNTGDPKADQLLQQSTAGSQVSDELCGRQLGKMLALMGDLERRLDAKRRNRDFQLGLNTSHIRLARALDSFGRYQAAHLSGVSQSLGSSQQCSFSQLLLDGEQSAVNMRFCWAKLSLEKHLDEQLKSRPRHETEEAETIMLSGVCIPEACHTISFERYKHLFKRLVDSQFKLPKSIYLEENLELKAIHCLIDEDSEHGLTFGGKIYVAALTCWCLLAIYVTYKYWSSPESETQQVASSGTNSEQQKQQQQQKPTSPLWTYLNQLNLIESWNDFTCKTSKPRDPNCRVDLDALNFLKVFLTLYVVLGHTVIYWWHGADDFIRTTTKHDNGVGVKIGLVATFVVDTFFVITGLVLTYSILNRQRKLNSIEQSKEKPSRGALATLLSDSRKCVEHIRNRYLRLMPMYLIVSWFNKFVFYTLSTEPFWDSGLDRSTTIGYCRQSEGLFDSLSPFHGYNSVVRRCIPQGWSVSADLFFAFVAVPVIMIIARKPKLGLTISVVLSLISLEMSWRTFSGGDPSFMWEINEMTSLSCGTVLNKVSNLYTAPHLRLSSIFSGVIAGYTLFLYNNGSFEWPNWFKGFATKASIVLILCPLASGAYQDELKAITFPYHHLLYPILCTVYRCIWAATNAVLLLRMSTDWKHYLLFSMGRSRFWRSVVKLSYAILLIHVDIILINLFDVTTNKTFLWTRIIFDYWSIQSICLAAAIVVYVVLENPLEKLTRKILE